MVECLSNGNTFMTFQGDLSERYSGASESGSSTDSHAETPENKDGESLLQLSIPKPKFKQLSDPKDDFFFSSSQ